MSDPLSPGGLPSEEPRPIQTVELRFREDAAERVACYTSLDDFAEGHPMALLDGSDEIWLCHIDFPIGRHLYRFLVDGEWMCDEYREVINVKGNSYNEIEVDLDDDDHGGIDDGRDNKMQAKKKAKRRRWRQKKKMLKARRRALQNFEEPVAAGGAAAGHDEPKLVDAKAQAERLQAALAEFESSQAKKVQSMSESLAKERTEALERLRIEREQWMAKVQQLQAAEDAAKQEASRIRDEMSKLEEQFREQGFLLQQAKTIEAALEEKLKLVDEERNSSEAEKKSVKEENKSLKRKMKSWKTEVKAKYQKMLDDLTEKSETTIRNQSVNIEYLKREVAKANADKAKDAEELTAANEKLSQLKKEREALELKLMDDKAMVEASQAKVRAAEEERESAHKKIRDLEAQVEELTRKQAGLANVSSKELDLLRKRETELVEEMKGLKASEQKAKEEAKELRKEKFALTDKLEATRAEHEKVVADLKVSAEQEATTAKASLQQAQAEVDQLKAELKSLSSSLDQQVQDLKQQLDTSKKEHAALKAVEEKAKEEIKKLLNDKWSLEKELTTTKAKLEFRIQEIEAGGAEREKEVSVVSARLEELAKEREEVLANHEKELQEQQAQVEKAKEEAETLRKNLSAVEAELRTHKDEKSALQIKLDKQLQTHKEAVDDLTAKIKEIQADRDSNLAAAQSSYAVLKKERDDMAARHETETKELNERIKTASDECENLRKNVATLEVESAKWKDSSDSLTHRLGQLEKDTTATIDSLRAQVKTLEDTKLALEATERKLTQEKSNLDKEYSDLKTNVQETEKKLRDELDTLSKKLNEELKVSEERKSQVELLDAADKRHKAQLETMTTQIDELTKEREQMTEDHKKEVTELSGQLTAAQTQAATAEKQAEQAKLAVEKAEEMSKAREDILQRSIEDIKKDLKEKEAKHGSVKTQILTVSEKSKKFREEVAFFKQAQMSFIRNAVQRIALFEKEIIRPIEENGKLLEDSLRKYKKELTERRKYFNLVQELRGNIRVCIRARPITENDAKRGNNADKQDKLENALLFPDTDYIALKRPGFEKKEYEFDRVYNEQHSQEEIFKDTKQLIGSVMDGYNVCIIAYGQTGSGKTYTMEGPPHNRGVNFRALKELFTICKRRAADYDYEISVSMMEIYNETVLDLLSSKEADKEGLKIRQGKDGVFVENLTEEDVKTEDDIIRLMTLGNKNRAVGRTDMNEHSSRSHSILTVNVQGHNFTAGITYYGKLHLIDLAGSERVSKSHATGDRLKEAMAINKSLSALGNVLQRLQQKSPHVPYRDSKLTYLLSDSLGGNSKCMMFINISPCNFDADETFCSLEFAAKVSRVELGQAQQNKVRAGVAAVSSPPPPKKEDGKPSERKAAATPAAEKKPVRMVGAGAVAKTPAKAPASASKDSGVKKPLAPVKK